MKFCSSNVLIGVYVHKLPRMLLHILSNLLEPIVKIIFLFISMRKYLVVLDGLCWGGGVLSHGIL
jgi:hypothetical protein